MSCSVPPIYIQYYLSSQWLHPFAQPDHSSSLTHYQSSMWQHLLDNAVFLPKRNGRCGKGNISCCDYWFGGGCVLFFEGISLLFLKSLSITEPRRQDCLHQAQLLFFWSTYSKLTGCLFMQPYTLQTKNDCMEPRFLLEHQPGSSTQVFQNTGHLYQLW